MSKLKFFSVAALVAGLTIATDAAQAQRTSAPQSPWRIAALDAAKAPLSAEGSSSSLAGSAESADPSAIIAVPPPLSAKKNTRDDGPLRPFSRIAIGTRSGSLGIGAQVATPIARWLNLRGGFDLFHFNYGLTNDGANYNGDLRLKSGLVSADVYPFHHSSFHVSPGLLIFKSNAGASMNVAGGATFSLGDNTYTSNPSDPVTGSGNLLFGRTIMPAFTIGFGNMIAREGRHWSVPVEIGAAYTGHTTAQLRLAGSACAQGYCMSTSDPSIQQSLTQEQIDINESSKRFQVYPILTTGVSYRF